MILTGATWGPLKESTPWGQVPLLEVDGQMLAQTGAINAYVARELGLSGADAFAAAKVDEFCDTVEECVNVCLLASYGKSVRLVFHTSCCPDLSMSRSAAPFLRCPLNRTALHLFAPLRRCRYPGNSTCVSGHRSQIRV